jgi:hypothetical protein
VRERDLTESHGDRTADERPLTPADSPAALAAAIGNRAFSVLARSGAGILDGGRVHPDVEGAIAAQRGGGSDLDAGIRASVAPTLGDPLTGVRVHTGPDADALAQAVDARAFTVGTDMFFAQGEYRPGSSDGDRLLAHELTHVAQQRDAPTAGPLVVSDAGDTAEREADQVSHELTG